MFDSGVGVAATLLKAWLDGGVADDGVWRWLHFEPPLELLVTKLLNAIDDSELFDEIVHALIGYLRHDTARYAGAPDAPWSILGELLAATETIIPPFHPTIPGDPMPLPARMQLDIRLLEDPDTGEETPTLAGALVDHHGEVSWVQSATADELLDEVDPAEAIEVLDDILGEPLAGAYAVENLQAAQPAAVCLGLMIHHGVLPFDHPAPDGVTTDPDGAEPSTTLTDALTDTSEPEDVPLDAPYWLREIVAWRLASDLARRHPSRLWIREAAPTASTTA